MATARRAAQEIEKEWPEWMKALSRPRRPQADVDENERRTDAMRQDVVAPTYSEVMATARRAAQEIAQEWPEWKRALSRPQRAEADAHAPRPESDASRK